MSNVLLMLSLYQKIKPRKHNCIPIASEVCATGLPLESQPKIGADDGGVDLQLFQELGAKSISDLASRKWRLMAIEWLGSNGWVELFLGWCLMKWMPAWMIYQMMVLGIVGGVEVEKQAQSESSYIDSSLSNHWPLWRFRAVLDKKSPRTGPQELFLRWSFCQFAEAHSRRTSGRSFESSLGHPRVEPSKSMGRRHKAKSAAPGKTRRAMLPEVHMETRLARPRHLEPAETEE